MSFRLGNDLGSYGVLAVLIPIVLAVMVLLIGLLALAHGARLTRPA